MKPVLCDLHTHTIASGHAYSTLKENIDAALSAGLKVFGTSEHGPAMPGTIGEMYFSNFKVVPKEIDGMRIVCGVEANILTTDGAIDVDAAMASKLDYVIAGIHSHCYADAGLIGNTDAIIGAMEHPFVRIISHPDDSRFPADRDALAKAAAAKGVALELNNGSLNPKSKRSGGRENIIELLEACAKWGTQVIIGSDSHICYEIGHVERALEMLELTHFPEAQVLNFDLDRLGFVLD